MRVSLGILLASILGCSSAPPQVGANKWIGYTEKGLASYYADRHQSNMTACGERYNHDLKTAAHKKIPCGSKLQVTNMDNDETVVVIVNDRGPFVDGRIVDLSKSAFSSIANTSSGLVTVQIEVIE